MAAGPLNDVLEGDLMQRLPRGRPFATEDTEADGKRLRAGWPDIKAKVSKAKVAAAKGDARPDSGKGEGADE